MSAPRPNRRASSRKQQKEKHLLDVKIRARKASEQRNRKLMAWLCWLVLLAGVIGGSWYGVSQGLRRYFWQNPDYNLTEIEIKTDGPLAREQVIALTGLREGVNIFSVDIAKAREALLTLPQIERAEIERMLPNKLVIDIGERKPVAWIAAKNHEDPSNDPKSFLVDRKGVLMKTQTNVPEYFHLPVIAGLATDNFNPGEVVSTPELAAALELIRLSTDDPARFQVSSIDLSLGYGMLVTDQRRARITFGLEHVDAQLERLNVLLDYIEKNGREVQTVNLLVQRNVPVTFAPPSDPGAEAAEAAALPTPAPRTAITPKTISKKTSIVTRHAAPVHRAVARKTPVHHAAPVKKHPAPAPTYTPTPVRRAIPVEPSSFRHG